MADNDNGGRSFELSQSQDAFEQMRQRIIDGDTSITAVQYDKARIAAERDEQFAGVQADAARAAADREAQTEHEAAVDALRQRARAAQDAKISGLQSAYRQAIDGIRAVRTGLTEFNTEVSGVQAEARRLGVTDIEIPRAFSVEWEMQRLDKDGSRPADWQWSGGYSPLHDEQYRAEAEQRRQSTEAHVAEREARRLAQSAEQKARRVAEQEEMDRQRQMSGLGY